MTTAQLLHKEGREEGLEQGLERGRHAKAIETARKMLEEGLDLFMISRVTGLPEDTLIEIRDTLL
ncbi:MAG TPA: hypothetical protein GXZ47_08785 [Treponema sp.]|nr:hypothetical protein [Treponema sp.]